MAAFGGGLGVVLVEAQFAAIQCPEDPSCVDRMMGRGLYGTLAMVGLVVAAVGGLVVLASPRRRRRHTR